MRAARAAHIPHLQAQTKKGDKFLAEGKAHPQGCKKGMGRRPGFF